MAFNEEIRILLDTKSFCCQLLGVDQEQICTNGLHLKSSQIYAGSTLAHQAGRKLNTVGGRRRRADPEMTIAAYLPLKIMIRKEDVPEVANSKDTANSPRRLRPGRGKKIERNTPYTTDRCPGNISMNNDDSEPPCPPLLRPAVREAGWLVWLLTPLEKGTGRTERCSQYGKGKIMGESKKDVSGTCLLNGH
ncbi:hypothetical protein B0H19DRAFT_1070225 [Mycena capillaripes]|nr:hypothetical protein B0H19DRAFT_1070225 [Mycena capillaripes]